MIDEMMPVKAIPLTQGQVSICDPEDEELVSQYKWCANWHPQIQRFYAVNNSTTKDGKRVQLRMHNLISGYAQCDHKNRDTLDNRQDNLREASKAKNSANVMARQGTTSNFKGVSWKRDVSKWQASIKVNQKSIYLGSYGTEEEAARTYDAAARIYFGEYGRYNFPQAGEQPAIVRLASEDR